VALVEASRSGGSRRWLGAWARAASTRSASFWRGGDDDWRRPAGLGRTVLGYLVGWQVGCAR